MRNSVLNVRTILSSRVTTAVLVAVFALAGAQLVASLQTSVFLPGNNTGYEPVQPIAYSHRLHAGELGIPCLYCHTGAEKGRHAGIPPAATCMNCHRTVTTSYAAMRAEDERATREQRRARRITSPELATLYAALALSDSMQRDPARALDPIAWIRIHRVPDFVAFDHSAHIAASVACQTCHGDVQTMERVRQVSDLTMGWCVNCHRAENATGRSIGGKRRVNAPTDCSACHH